MDGGAKTEVTEQNRRVDMSICVRKENQDGNGEVNTVRNEINQQPCWWVVSHKINDAQHRLPPPGQATHRQDACAASQMEVHGSVGGGMALGVVT